MKFRGGNQNNARSLEQALIANSKGVVVFECKLNLLFCTCLRFNRVTELKHKVGYFVCVLSCLISPLVVSEFERQVELSELQRVRFCCYTIPGKAIYSKSLVADCQRGFA